MAESINHPIAGVKNIHQLVYDLRPNELQQILEAVKQNKSGSKQSLRKRVLSLLTVSAPITKVLKQKIVQVYNSRPEQNQQHQPPPQVPVVQQLICLQRFVQQSQHPIHNQSTASRRNRLQPFIEHLIPGVQFEHLPFYKTVQTLLKPTYFHTNIDCAGLIGIFYLTDNVRRYIVKSWNIARQEYKIKIILRFLRVGLNENVIDRLPYNLTVSVNDRQCKLPTLNIPTITEITPWRFNEPIDITRQTDLRNILQTTLKITWSDEPHEYIAGVFVAQKLTWNDLLVELKKRRPSDKTKELIKKSMENDADMIVNTMFVTVMDPITKLRMKLPARGVDCIHLQCFDAIQFLQMNEEKQTWTCPICKKKIKFENIEVDDYFLNVIQSPDLSQECEKVVLLKDGTWSERKNREFSNHSGTNDIRSTNNIEIFTLSDSDSNDDADKRSNVDEIFQTMSERKNRDFSNHSGTNDIRSTNNIEVFTLSDSDSNDDADKRSNVDEIFPKPKRSKYNPPQVEEFEHIEETVNLTNYFESDLVLDLSLKNNSTSTSASSKYIPVITIGDEPDIEVFTLSDSDSNDDADKRSNVDEIFPKPKRSKYNPPQVEESEHIEETVNLTNSSESDLVLDLSLKNNSTSTSASSKYIPVITIGDEPDIEVFTLSDSDSNDDADKRSNVDEIFPKPKRSKYNPPQVEESEHIEETVNLTNSSESDLVLDLSLKNNSTSTSASSKYIPVITIGDEPDSPSLIEYYNV